MKENKSTGKRSRTLLAVSLAVVIGGISILSILALRAGRPESLWRDSRIALEAGDKSTARLHLENLVRKAPEHAEAHLTLARLYGGFDASAKAADPEAALKALAHLSRAARLRPDDVPLQKELMKSLESRGELHDAASVAARVVRIDPTDAAALYLIAWRAVAERNDKLAADALERLARAESPPSFRGLALRAQWAEVSRQDVLLDDAFRTCIERAASLDAEQLAALAPRERRAMCAVMLSAQTSAADLKLAHRRAEQLLEVLGRVHSQSEEEPGVAGELAEVAARSTAALARRKASKFDGAALSQHFDDSTADLLIRGDSILQTAIRTSNPSPLVYHQAAMAAFARDANQEALSVLRRGIRAWTDIPLRRREELMSLHLATAQLLVTAGEFDQSKPHVEVLIGDESTAGWGHMTAGLINAIEGRQERALNHFRESKTRLGATNLVRLALAQTYVRLNRFDEALPHLNVLHLDLARWSTEEAAWARRLGANPGALQLAKVRALLDSQQWRQALDALVQTRGTAHEPAALRMVIARAFRAGRHEEASRLLIEAREGFPDDAAFARMHVTALFEAGEWSAAREAAENFADAYSHRLEARLIPIELLADRRQFDQALGRLDKLESQFVDNPDYLLFKARLLIAAGRPKDALRIAERLNQDARTAPAGATLGIETALADSDSQAAKRWLGSEALADTDRGQRALWEAQLATLSNQHRESVDLLASALAFEQVQTPARLALLQSLAALASSEGPAAAAAKLRELRATYPEDPALLLVAAELALADDRSDVAQEILVRLEQLKPGTPNVPWFRARVHVLEGRFEEAAKEIARALDRKSHYVPARILAAEVELARGHFAGALQHTEVALAADSNRLGIYLLKAVALRDLGKTTEAVAVLEQTLATDSRFVPAWLRLADFHESDDRPEAALDAVRRGRSVRPSEPALLHREILLLHRLHRAEDARRIAEEVTAKDSSLPAILAVGRAFYEAGDLETAERFARMGRDAADSNHAAAARWLEGNIALARANRGGDPIHFEKAREHFRAVLDYEPNHLIALNNLAALASEVFLDPREALDLTRRITEMMAGRPLPPEVLDTVVTVYRRSGDVDRALEIMRTSIPSLRSHPLYQFQLAMIHAAQRQGGAAQAALKRAMESGLEDQRAAQVREALSALQAEAAG